MIVLSCRNLLSRMDWHSIFKFMGSLSRAVVVVVFSSISEVLLSVSFWLYKCCVKLSNKED